MCLFVKNISRQQGSFIFDHQPQAGASCTRLILIFALLLFGEENLVLQLYYFGIALWYLLLWQFVLLEVANIAPFCVVLVCDRVS